MPDLDPSHMRKPRPGESVEVEIDTLNAEGFGVASLEVTGDGRLPRRYSVNVRGALPGERVRAEIGWRRGTRFFARARTLLSPSSDRIAARCSHFEDCGSARAGCGGCSLQSLPYSLQLALKRERLVGLLHQVGFDSNLVAQVLGQEQPWYYRNKMEYTFHPPRTGPTVLGLYPSGSREVLALRECYLLSPFASALVPRLGEWAADHGLPAYWPRRNSGFLRTLTIREGKRTGERMLELTTSADETVPTRAGTKPASTVAEHFRDRVLTLAGELGGEVSGICWTRQLAERGSPTRFVTQPLYGKTVLSEVLQLADGQALRFEIHPRAFFQPATLQAERLYTEVLRAAALSRHDGAIKAVDLYCGTGTIALCLAPYCRQVVGIELNEAAVDNAQRNALFNGIENVRFVAGDVGQLLASGALDEDLRDVDLVVVDPPRSGLAPPALTQISAIGAPNLVYVSCSPEALARDLLQLVRLGYRLRSVQPVDMFPQTAHIESVARLDRAPKNATHDLDPRP